MADQDDSASNPQYDPMVDSSLPSPKPNTGASVPDDQPVSSQPWVNSLGDQANAPGNDAITPTLSPVDFLAPEAVEGLAGATEALAPQAGRLMADDAGVLRLPGQGLVPSQAAAGFTDGTEAAKALMEKTHAATLTGEASHDQYVAAYDKYVAAMDKATRHLAQLKARPGSMARRFADGGDVSPMTADQTQTAFDKASGPDSALPDLPQPQQTPQPDAAPSGAVLNMFNPGGELVGVAQEQAHDAMSQGYELPTAQQLHDHVNDAKYGGFGQQSIAALEGAASANTFGLSTGLEKAAGIDPEDIEGRRTTGYGHTIGEIGGIGASLLTGAGEANLLSKAGGAAAKLAGLGEGASIAAKIGSAAVRGAAENSLFEGGNEVSKMFSQNADPGDAIERAIPAMGLAGLVGAGIGGVAAGVVSPLWKAASESKLAASLKGLTGALGGVEGEAVTPETVVDGALDRLGLKDSIAPDIRARLMDKPAFMEASTTLEQRGVINSSSSEHLENLNNTRDLMTKTQANALGAEPGDIAGKGEIDKYAAGRTAGEAAAQHAEDLVGPLGKQYDAFGEQFADKPLVPSIADKTESFQDFTNRSYDNLRGAQRELSKALESRDPGAAIEAQAKVKDAQSVLKQTLSDAQAPGTTDSLSQNLAALAKDEGWLGSPSSDIMREYGRVQKELPLQKTLSDLTNYIKQVGQNTASKLPFGQSDPVERAGGLMKKVLRQAESDEIARHVGAEGGQEAVDSYRQLQQHFKAAADIIEPLTDQLGIHSSISGAPKAIRAMSAEAGERVLQRLSGKNDAAWLENLQKNFPNAANVIRKNHVDNLLAASKQGDGLSSQKLMTNLFNSNSISPQLRDFIASPEAQADIKAAHSIVEALKDPNHNFSNTSPVAEKLGRGGLSTAISFASALSGHNPAVSWVLGHLGESLGKSVPDAIRLAALKYAGTAKPPNASAFKAAVDIIGKTIRGNDLAENAAKAVFEDGGKVIPDSKLPTEAMRDKLDAKLTKFQKDQSDLANPGSDVAHYLPQHATAIAETSTRAVNYLNTLKPSAQRLSPLDPPLEPSDIQKDRYNSALDIANQPLSVLQHIKDGTLTVTQVQDIQAMYPKLYTNLVQKLTNHMNNQLADKEPVSYETRIGLSLFLGHPMDSTLTPEAIQAAQPVPAAPPAQGQATSPKKSTSKLGKLPNDYMTQAQRAEKDRGKE